MGAEPHLFPTIPEWTEPLPAPGSCALAAPPTPVTWSAQQDGLTHPLSLTHFRASRNLHSCTVDPSCPRTRRLSCLAPESPPALAHQHLSWFAATLHPVTRPLWSPQPLVLGRSE